MPSGIVVVFKKHDFSRMALSLILIKCSCANVVVYRYDNKLDFLVRSNPILSTIKSWNFSAKPNKISRWKKRYAFTEYSDSVRHRKAENNKTTTETWWMRADRFHGREVS